MIEKLQYWCERNEYVLNSRENEVTTSIGVTGAILANVLGAAMGFAFYKLSRKYIHVRFYDAPTPRRVLFAGLAAAGFFTGLEVGLAQMKGRMIKSISTDGQPLSDVRSSFSSVTSQNDMKSADRTTFIFHYLTLFP